MDKNNKDRLATIIFIAVLAIGIFVVVALSCGVLHVSTNAEIHNAATQVQRQR